MLVLQLPQTVFGASRAAEGRLSDAVSELHEAHYVRCRLRGSQHPTPAEGREGFSQCGGRRIGGGTDGRTAETAEGVCPRLADGSAITPSAIPPATRPWRSLMVAKDYYPRFKIPGFRCAQ